MCYSVPAAGRGLPGNALLPAGGDVFRVQAEEQQFAQWEQDMAVARSQGQFFQSLYQADRKKPVGEDVAHLKVQLGGQGLAEGLVARASRGL